MAQSEDLDFLHQRFAVTVERPTNFTLRCRNGSKVSDSMYLVEGSRLINLPVMCALLSDVMTCTYIDIIDGGKDIILPIETGYADIVNLTHETLDSLQLEETTWEIPAISPHSDALSLQSAWYERIIPMVTAGIAVVSAITVIGIAFGLFIHYNKKVRAALRAAVDQ